MSYSIHTNQQLLDLFSQRNLIRTYAYFLKFKYVFSSSRLHKGNKAKLSRITGVSDKNVRIHIAKMLKMGWIREVDGDYVFISKNSMYDLYGLNKKLKTFKCKIIVSKEESIKDIITKLSCKLIEWNIKKQQNCIDLKKRNVSYLINSKVSDSDKAGKTPHVKRRLFSPKEKARLREYNPMRFRYSASEHQTTSLSSHGFARVLNVSLAAANRLKSQMVALGLISIERRYKHRKVSPLGRVRFEFLKSEGLVPGNKFCKNMKMFTRISDGISINYNLCLKEY